MGVMIQVRAENIAAGIQNARLITRWSNLQLPGGGTRVHWKGAAERVLSSCTNFYENGIARPLDERKVGAIFRGFYRP